MLLLILNLVKAEEPNIVYKEKTEIDFEAVDIEGNLKKPTGQLISENSRAIFNPLIKVRESWSKEMCESIKEIH